MTTIRTPRPRTPHQYEDYTLGEHPAAGQVSCELVIVGKWVTTLILVRTRAMRLGGGGAGSYHSALVQQLHQSSNVESIPG